MSVVLVGIAERSPEAIEGESILGTVKVLDVPIGSVTLFVIAAFDDTDWGEAPLDSIEWVAPRAIGFDDLLRRCVDDNVLPARFGTAFASAESLIDDVVERSEPIIDDLRRLGDVHEYRLEVTLDRTSAAQAASGLDYLRRRKNEQQSIGIELNRVLEMVSARTRDLLVVERSERSVKASALSLPEAWAELLDELSGSTIAAIEHEGPLPPFHFMSRPLSDDEI